MTEKATNTKNIASWITFFAMAIGIAVIASIYWKQNLTVQEIEVHGIYFTEEDEILQIVEGTIGQHPDSLNLAELSSEVEKLNYVKSIVPYVEPSGNLRINIKEREPIALLVDGSNRMYVDKDGIKLPLLEGKNRNVPLLYGYKAHSISDTLNTPSFLQIREFLVEAQANGFGWVTISEVAYHENEGVIALSHENGVKLIFGKNDFQTKLENWEAFYAQIVRTKGIDSMREVDLRFMNQVVTNEI